MKYSALIVAAGSGTRMQLGYNKVFAKLPDGRTILETTIDVFLQDEDCGQIVVVTDASEFRRFYPKRIDGKIVICQGGSTRQESVNNGLQAVICDLVFIHDGARPFLDQESLGRLKKAMETEDAALLCVACKDTIKKADENGYIVETYERSTLRSAQTPQAFRTELIMECMRKAFEDGYTGTDDCSLAERYSDVKIKAVEGSYSNFKVTTPEDLR